MLLYSTRTAVFKNGDKSTLWCRITLPTGAEDEELGARIADFYKEIYNATYSAAREYAERISVSDGRLVTLDISCTHAYKNDRILVKRTYTITGKAGAIAQRSFVDGFALKYDKTKKYSVKEHQKYNK